MPKSILMLLPLLGGVVATPALAQVTGRAEVKVGYDEARAAVRIDRTLSPKEFGFGKLGVGAEVGADYNFGTAGLVGIYGGMDFSGSKGCKDELWFEGDEFCLKSTRNAYAGLRAGLKTGDSGLIYIKGGYSRGTFRASFDDGDGTVLSGRDTIGGYHLGAGFELNVSRNVYLKGEYVHTQYRHGFRSELTPPDESFRPTRNQLMAGVGIRFGGMAPPPPPPVLAPPPPPPVVPMTQTCPDGTVIDAAAVCPAPPPPPPPPPVSGERG